MKLKKDIDHLIESFVSAERNTASNPFISTRIMAVIEQERDQKLINLSPVWMKTLVAASIVLAIFAGIATGNFYQPALDSTDVVLMNDNRMESFGLFVEIGKE